MLDRRAFLAGAATVVGAGAITAGLIATRWFDEVAGWFGVEPPEVVQEVDERLLERIAHDEAEFLGRLRILDDEIDDDRFSQILQAAEEHAQVLRMSPGISVSPLELGDLDAELERLVTDRLRDAKLARSGEFAALLGSLAASHRQQQILAQRVTADD